MSEAEGQGRPRGLLIDFGGVLTTRVFGSFEAFCEAEGLVADTVARRFREDVILEAMAAIEQRAGRLGDRLWRHV